MFADGISVCDYVDGIKVFPTAPVYLRQHLKKWKNSNNMRDQLRQSQRQLEELRRAQQTSERDYINSLRGENSPFPASPFQVGSRTSLNATSTTRSQQLPSHPVGDAGQSLEEPRHPRGRGTS